MMLLLIVLGGFGRLHISKRLDEFNIALLSL